MSAIAIFSCRPNSHPFQDRNVYLHEHVKIGRAVARARPSTQNAIFDCKVLSRNHAMLWYENSRFLLQDTKSSNGTFVNNQRLSKGTEESPPTEIFSGDIIQFGVDVMENSRRVTHSCIIAVIQLFHPDGTEASNNGSEGQSFLPDLQSGISLVQGAAHAVQPQELYQLSQYLQEALHREQILEQKLTTLQTVLVNTQVATDSTWHALIDEDRMLSRLELLESQLQTFSKNHSEDSLRLELVALKEEKSRYESTVKESLRQMLDEKMEATEKATELEQSLKNSEEECQHLRQMCEDTQKELQTLAEQHQTQLTELTKVQKDFKEVTAAHAEELQTLVNERDEIHENFEEMEIRNKVISDKFDALTKTHEFTKEQLNNLRSRVDSLKDSTICIPEIKSQGVQVEMVNLLDLQLLQNQPDSDDGSEKGDDNHELESKVKETLDMFDEELKAHESFSHEDLLEKLSHMKTAVEHYKGLLKKAEEKMDEYRNQIKELESQTDKAVDGSPRSSRDLEVLQERLQSSDKQLDTLLDQSLTNLKEHINKPSHSESSSSNITSQLKEQIEVLEKEITGLKQHSMLGEDLESQQLILKDQLARVTENCSELEQSLENKQCQITLLKELLQEARKSLKCKEDEVTTLKRDLQTANKQIDKYNGQSDQLQSQISSATTQLLDKNRNVEQLQDELHKAEVATKDVKHQILLLQEKVQEYKSNAAIASLEAQHYREKVQLLECQLSPNSSAEENIATMPEDDMLLKEDCLRSRIKIKILEEKVLRLESDKSYLLEAKSELEESFGARTPNHSVDQLQNLTDAQKEAQSTREELQVANEKCSNLEEKCNSLEDELVEVLTDYKKVTKDYSELACKSKAAASCAIIPIIVLLFAVVMAFYPTLSQLTGTAQFSWSDT